MLETISLFSDMMYEDSRLMDDIEEPVIDFTPEEKYCPVHDIPLLVMKSNKRMVKSIEYIPFIARRTYLSCPLCKDENGVSWKHSPGIPMLTRGKSPFSMDIVVRVGKMKFLECMRRNDIQERIWSEYGIHVSDGTISKMGMEFLARMKSLHLIRSDRIQKEIRDGEGYILGIDTTGDGGSDRIFIGMDLLRDWVLYSSVIPSESEGNMKVHVEFLKEQYGLPHAGVCDMGGGVNNVLNSNMKGVPVKICNYHFLGDIGKDLMKISYSKLRSSMIDSKLKPFMQRMRKDLYHTFLKREVNISAAVIGLRKGSLPEGLSMHDLFMLEIYDVLSWMLRYNEDSKGLRFPFSLPYLQFYERCLKGLEVVSRIRRTYSNLFRNDNSLSELENILWYTLKRDERGCNVAREELLKGKALFEELREIMHVPRKRGDIPRDKLIIQNNDMIKRMRSHLEKFRERLRKKAEIWSNSMERIVLTHLDRYWENIILDNVVIIVDGEKVLIEIPRTSSVYESCFGIMKSDVRKRLGKMDTGIDLNLYGDYLCYVQNLKSESYVSLMLGSIENLVKAFNEIPEELVRSEMRIMKGRRKGYDVTNSGFRSASISYKDIIGGVDYLERWAKEKSGG